jgi:Zn-dependent protease/predicted transcriptional regulator
MMLGGFGLGHWFGFRIRIDASWFIVFALVTWTFAVWELPVKLPGREGSLYLWLGVVGALLLFLSVLLHELAHSVVARSRGIPVHGITLFIFGGVAEMSMEARTPGDEFALTVAGPLASLTLAALFGFVSRAGWSVGIDTAGALAGTLAFLNLVLAVFNMIPAFPLDGGRVLHAAIWKLSGDQSLATRWATFVGRAFGWTLIGFGFALIFVSFLSLSLQGARLSGLWMILLGWFLGSAAAAAARFERFRSRIVGIPVASVFGGKQIAVPESMSVQELVRSMLLRTYTGGLPVERRGRIVGTVTPADVAEVRPNERREVPVLEVMVPIEDVPTVNDEASLAEVTAGLQASGGDRVVVTHDDEILGVLTLRDVNRWIERTRELGLDPQDVIDE